MEGSKWPKRHYHTLTILHDIVYNYSYSNILTINETVESRLIIRFNYVAMVGDAMDKQTGSAKILASIVLWEFLAILVKKG